MLFVRECVVARVRAAVLVSPFQYLHGQRNDISGFA